MFSDLFVFDNSFFSDPFEILQENRDDLIQENNNPIDESSSLDQIASALLSSSPPRVELENLSLSQSVKTEEECQLNFDSFSGFGNCFSPHSFDGAYETGTGDLQKVKTNMQIKNVLSSSPLSTEKSFMEEANFKVGRYSVEERKEKIDRYRAKRTQRNFNKTIKYACRKTLADNRPRIRGRFARNDEAGEIPKASMFHRYEDEDDLWIRWIS